MCVGIDPGGKKSFGVAIIDDNTVRHWCVSCAEEAADLIAEEPLGVGIDAPMWWSAGPSGDRFADKWIRKTYKIGGGTVQAANSLRGAALIQGALFAELLRAKFPRVLITEVHPKALLKMKSDHGWLLHNDPAVKAVSGEHERDAMIAAIAARESFSGRWRRDLSLTRGSGEQDPKSYWLKPMHYFWPE